MEQQEKAIHEINRVPAMHITENNQEQFSEFFAVELPPALKKIWSGNFHLVCDPKVTDIPFVNVNFVVSREGIFNLKNNPGGGAISQENRADAFGMALLRSYADAVMVGAGTLGSEPNHVWNTDFIFDKFQQMKGLESLRAEFANFRSAQGKKSNPPTFFMTNSGDINFNATVFHPDSRVETYVVTGERGKGRIREANPAYKHVLTFGDEALDEKAMMHYLRKEMGIEFLLHEGGRSVVAALVQKKLVHQFQLTRMRASPKGLSPNNENADYLFSTPNHEIPPEAKVLEARSDEAEEATLYTLDFRGVSKM